MNPLILREGGPSRLVELRPEVADSLSSAGIIQLVRTDRPGRWEVSALNQIGAVNVNGLQIVIQPKISISRLVFLMGYARGHSFWRNDHVLLDPHSDLPEALAHTFIRLVARAVDQGLLNGYRTVDETLTVLRGRIREADQLRTRFGRAIPLEVRYDDFTVDIPENQVLLAAVERLMRTLVVGSRHRGPLLRLRLLLADVTTPTAGAARPRWIPSRLNAKYQPALELAELILDGRSFEQRVGRTTISGYLFNVATMFEDFVTVALRECLKPLGGRSRLQYQDKMDEAGVVPIRPDFVWLRGDRPMIVADAKYKAEKPSGFPQADLYQMLAYCTVLGLREGHLIYARGNEPALVHDVRNSRVRITAHTLNLDQEPGRVLAEVGDIGRAMMASATESIN